MELRSSRSRSKTPFTSIESFDKEFMEKGSIVEKIVSRSTRRTTYKVNENATSSTDEVTSVNTKPTRRSMRSERSSRKIHKTSDYSSEDGENEVSSTRTVSQNDKNQLIEDARAAANGSSDVSALNLYKKSGRYWDLYPKTDWTYSHHSKDRVELAPGVVAMPNMSRKTIHSVHEDTDIAHKETNTETFYVKSNIYATNSENLYSFQPRNLFTNNNRYNEYEKTTQRVGVVSRIRRSCVSVFTSIFTVISYVFHVQTTCFAKLHQFAAWIMLLDTWLLCKSHSGNKSSRLVALCLVPLFLFGGWWILSSLGSAVYGAYFKPTLSESLVVQTLDQYEDYILNNPESNVGGPGGKFVHNEKNIISDVKALEDPLITQNTAAVLSDDQLQIISRSLRESLNKENEFKTDSIVERIVSSTSFQSIISNNVQHNEKKMRDNLDQLNRQQRIIDSLRDEIEKMKVSMIEAEEKKLKEYNNFLRHVKDDNAQQNAHLLYQIGRCCRKSLVNIEGYVGKILTTLLNDVDFLKSQKGLENYFNTIFIAKEDLESHLNNLTANLDSKYYKLMEDNSRIIMAEISKKIKLDMNEYIAKMKLSTSSHSPDENIDQISDDHIKNIVKQVLAIYDADKTGLVDYAMESMGGQIITTRCTENYHYGKAVVSVLGIPLWYPVNSPRTIINPSINPGECWAFQNFPGFVVIRLSNNVKVEAFSMEHISKLLVPNGKIDSAPKQFEVYGLINENDKDPVKLGEYTYDIAGEPLQFFPTENDDVFGIIEIRIISNHGNPNYTCLYRFRVHGKMRES